MINRWHLISITKQSPDSTIFFRQYEYTFTDCSNISLLLQQFFFSFGFTKVCFDLLMMSLGCKKGKNFYFRCFRLDLSYSTNWKLLGSLIHLTSSKQKALVHLESIPEAVLPKIILCTWCHCISAHPEKEKIYILNVAEFLFQLYVNAVDMYNFISRCKYRALNQLFAHYAFCILL